MRDILDLHKTVQHFEEETHYGIRVKSHSINFEILINDRIITRWRRHTTHVIARICNPCPQSTSRKVTHSKLKKSKK